MNLNGLKTLLNTASALFKSGKIEPPPNAGATNCFGKNFGDAANFNRSYDTGGLDAATRRLIEFRQNRQTAAVQQFRLEGKADDEDYTPKSVIFRLKTANKRQPDRN